MFSIAFQPQAVAEHSVEETRYVEPIPGVRLWYSADGALFALEVESRASERVELEKIAATVLNGQGTISEGELDFA